MTADINEELTALARSSMPFAETLGLSIAEGAPARVVGLADWDQSRCTAGDALHGGYLMACIDTVGSLNAFLNLPEGSLGTSTIESKTNFLGAVRSGRIVITASPIHIGRTTMVIQTDVHSDGKLITRSTQTQAVLHP
jgi:1,4-dihydroxy-2-naphthoyl-CoA hydrolase